MADTRQLSVTLPEDLAALVAQKVEAGSYASIDEVLIEGVRALLRHDESFETWLRNEVVAGDAEYTADPSRGIPAEMILARIKERRAAARDAMRDR